MKKYQPLYVIFELPEPNEVAETSAVKVGLAKNGNVVYILEDEFQAQLIQDVVGTWPQRIQQTLVNHWAYANKVVFQEI